MDKERIEAALQACDSSYTPCLNVHLLLEDILEEQKNMVEVVRCKDCKYRGTLELHGTEACGYSTVDYDKDSKCPCRTDDPFYSWYPDDDWFCAYGEKKESL